MGDAAEFVFGLRKEVANFIEVVGAAGDVDEVGETFERIVDLVSDGCGEATGGCEFFGTHQCAFGHAAFGDVAEDENDADHFAGAVADGGAAVVDADLGAILGDEEGVVGQADDCAEAANLVDRVFNGSACLFVEDGEDVVEGFAFGLGLLPAGELFGDEVHEVDVAVGVAGDDCVSDAADGGVQPLLASVRLFAAQLDLLNLPVVGSRELMEDSAGLQYQYSCGESGEDDESDPCVLVEFDVGCRVFGAASGDDVQKLVHLGAQVVHVLLTLEHMLLHSGSVDGR